MQNKKTISVAEAAELASTHKNTIRSWIDKKHIHAERAGDGASSAWVIDRASFEAYLKHTGKLTEETPLKEPVKSEASEDCDPPNLLSPNPEDKIKAKSADTGFQNRERIRQQNRSAKPLEKPFVPKQKKRGRKERPRTCAIRVTLRHVKDAMRGLSLEEQVNLRDYLNNRIRQEVGI